MSDTKETDDFYVEFVKEVDLPGGDVMLTFDLGAKAVQASSELGLKFLLYLCALNISADQAFQTIWDAHEPKGDPDDGN